MNLLEKVSDKIRHIQSEPEGVKVRYVWSVAIILFILTVAAWLVYSKISLPNVRASRGTSAPVVNNDAKEKLRNDYDDLKNNVLPELRNLLKDEGKTTEPQPTPTPVSIIASTPSLSPTPL